MLKRLVFVLARAAFGAKFALDGYENLSTNDDMVAYAESAGVPFAGVLVPTASLALLAGGVLLAIGLAPVLGVVGIAAFLLGVTPELHDFWNETGEERDAERSNFARNLAFLGGAIAFGVAATDRDHE